MTQVIVPVRYPLSEHSQSTLAEAIQIVEEEAASLTILHINLHQSGKQVTRSQLKSAVEAEFGRIGNVRYAVRKGLFVEQAILEEIAAEEADVVVIGKKQVGRLRQVIHRLTDDPDIDSFLRSRLDCRVVTVG